MGAPRYLRPPPAKKPFNGGARKESHEKRLSVWRFQLPLTAHFRAWAARDPFLLCHKAIYFIGMGACAAYYPFLVMRLRELGLDCPEPSGAFYAFPSIRRSSAAPSGR